MGKPSGELADEMSAGGPNILDKNNLLISAHHSLRILVLMFLML